MRPRPSLMTPEFEKYAPLLNDLVFSETARPFYEMLSGALMWDDEKPSIPFSEIGWFRVALAYRTSVILGDPRVEFEHIWVSLQRAAPKWPGFRPERCTPSPELLDCINNGKKSCEGWLDRLDAAAKREKPH
jgi:hypothetical protein